MVFQDWYDRLNERPAADLLREAIEPARPFLGDEAVDAFLGEDFEAALDRQVLRVAAALWNHPPPAGADHIQFVADSTPDSDNPDAWTECISIGAAPGYDPIKGCESYFDGYGPVRVDVSTAINRLIRMMVETNPTGSRAMLLGSAVADFDMLWQNLWLDRLCANNRLLLTRPRPWRLIFEGLDLKVGLMGVVTPEAWHRKPLLEDAAAFVSRLTS